MRNWGTTLAIALLAGGCAGEGCLAEIPNGFPTEARVSNAVQLRLSSSAIAGVEDRARDVVNALFPDGLSFEVPPICGDTEVCCNVPSGTCGIAIDIDRRANDAPRLQVDISDQPDGPIETTVRMRVKTTPGPLIVNVLGSTCTVGLDTEASGGDSMAVVARLRLAVDAVTNTTRVDLESLTIDDLDSGDIDIRGSGFVCGLADTFKGIVINLMSDALGEQAAGLLEDQLCKPCLTGSECSAGATCSEGICRSSEASCEMELGVTGRLDASMLLPGFGPDALLDLYVVAGGTADSTAGGLSMGVVAGAHPAGTGAGCGPSFPAPELPAGGVPRMAALDRNDTAEVGSFDFALGIHEAFLDRAGWALYESGLLCARVDSSVIDVLDSDTLSLLIPSMVDLLGDEVAPVALGLRPQSPPDIAVGGDGLLAVSMPGLIMDFYAHIDERSVRLFSATLDLNLPLGLEIDGDGAIIPTIGNIEQALSNVTVETTGLLGESADEITAKFGALGAAAVPLLSDAIGPIALPEVAGLQMAIPSGGIRATEGSFVGVFGNLTSATPMAALVRTETRASIRTISAPGVAAYSAARLERSQRPRVVLDLEAVAPGGADAEWQIRIDRGAWSPYSAERVAVLDPPQFWLAGDHIIEVRARAVGQPTTTDSTPVVLVATIEPEDRQRATEADRPHDAHIHDGAADHPHRTTGCSVAGDRAPSGWPLAALGLVVLFAASRLQRGRVAACCVVAVGLWGCTVGETAQPADANAAIGKWASIAADDSRVVVAAYDERERDLVVGEVSGDDDVRWRVVDPDGDVGAWTSIALVDGRVRVAYQHRDGGTLRFATEHDNERWTTHTIDSDGEGVGRYASVAVASDGTIGVAYMVERFTAGDGRVVSQLRWARASTTSPSSAGDWTISAVAEVDVAGARPSGGLPPGTGLYASAVWLDADRPAIAFYDRDSGDLRLAVRDGEWTAIDLDIESDAGAWASAAVDSAGTLHVAYQDLTRSQLRYVTWSDGAIGSIEVVDDGRRGDDRYPVGAAANLVLSASDEPSIVYQNSHSADVVVARRQSGSWSTRDVLTGSVGYGFWMGAARAGSDLWVGTSAYDRSIFPKPATFALDRSAL